MSVRKTMNGTVRNRPRVVRSGIGLRLGIQKKAHPIAMELGAGRVATSHQHNAEMNPRSKGAASMF